MPGHYEEYLNKRRKKSMMPQQPIQPVPPQIEILSTFDKCTNPKCGSSNSLLKKLTELDKDEAIKVERFLTLQLAIVPIQPKSILIISKAHFHTPVIRVDVCLDCYTIYPVLVGYQKNEMEFKFEQQGKPGSGPIPPFMNPGSPPPFIARG